MVSPNWPSDDDPDYTPDFAEQSDELDFADRTGPDIEEIHENIEDLVDDG